MPIHPSATIHPTAIIDVTARVGERARIGPYVCIEGPAEIGLGCVLEAHSVLTGRVRLGVGVRISHGAVIGGWPQDLSYDPATISGVEIGEATQIREHCTIHRGTAPGSVTSVGARCLLMAGAHLGHNTMVGDDAIIANHVLLGGYVEVADRVFIGGGSVFHQHMRIGRGAMIQGDGAFSKDIPPYTLAAEHNCVWGLNVVGLRRQGIAPAERAELKAAFKLLYRSGHNVAQALRASRGRGWGNAAAEFWRFVATANQRGICAFGGREEGKTAEG